MTKILIAIATYDGDAYCRDILFKTLRGLSKPEPISILFVSDEGSPDTTRSLRVWREKNFREFLNIEIIESPAVPPDLSFHLYETLHNSLYPIGRFALDSSGSVYESPVHLDFIYRMAIKRIIPKRETARRWAVENGFDYILFLDSDLEVESAVLQKLLERNCGVSAVLYNNWDLEIRKNFRMMNERAYYFSHEAFEKFAYEWDSPPNLIYESTISFQEKDFNGIVVWLPRRYTKRREFHVSAADGGCYLVRRDYFTQTNFTYHEVVPLVAMADDKVFFLPLFFNGLDDIRVVTDIKYTHHLSDPKKKIIMNCFLYDAKLITLEAFENSFSDGSPAWGIRASD